MAISWTRSMSLRSYWSKRLLKTLRTIMRSTRNFCISTTTSWMRKAMPTTTRSRELSLIKRSATPLPSTSTWRRKSTMLKRKCSLILEAKTGQQLKRKSMQECKHLVASINTPWIFSAWKWIPSEHKTSWKSLASSTLLSPNRLLHHSDTYSMVHKPLLKHRWMLMPSKLTINISRSYSMASKNSRNTSNSSMIGLRSLVSRDSSRTRLPVRFKSQKF